MFEYLHLSPDSLLYTHSLPAAPMLGHIAGWVVSQASSLPVQPVLQPVICGDDELGHAQLRQEPLPLVASEAPAYTWLEGEAFDKSLDTEIRQRGNNLIILPVGVLPGDSVAELLTDHLLGGEVGCGQLLTHILQLPHGIHSPSYDTTLPLDIDKIKPWGGILVNIRDQYCEDDIYQDL